MKKNKTKSAKIEGSKGQLRYDLKGEVAIVTGAQGMLGSEYCATLSDAGAAVAVFDISNKTNPRIKALKDKGRKIIECAVDLTNKKEVDKAVKKVASDLGVPTILINNAGLGAMPNRPVDQDSYFENYPEEYWDKIIDSHMKSMFLVSQSVIRAMKAGKKKGSIVNISSTYGIVTPDQSVYEYRRKRGEIYFKPVSYSVAKSAVLNFTRWLAEYCGPYGIRVNTLAPGGVFTDDLEPEFVEEYKKRTILGRMAEKTDYNGAILFLASYASSYMTGSTLIVDGGWTAR